jgi:hypothetical protein
MDTLQDNLCQWDGTTRGRYEVWYFTLNHMASGSGFWFRYTFDIPVDAQHAPEAALWGFFFDPAQPERTFGLKRSYSTEKLTRGDGREFLLKLGSAAFGANYLQGELTEKGHDLRWDLSFEPSPSTYYHIPQRLRALLPLKTIVCSPNLDVRFRGRITADGRAFELPGDPGCQSHIWGRKHAESWVWCHCNAFQDESSAVFEGLAARPKVMGLTPPLMSSVYLRYQDEAFYFNSLQVKNDLRLGIWNLQASNRQARLSGTARCELHKLIAVPYDDPDGEKSYCANSEISDLELQLERRSAQGSWRPPVTLRAHGTTHLEFGSRKPHPSVKGI